ncbi:hypothetical protein EW146_g2512 [Bondarzewia mesenterica]|uniref:Glycoside hydrolase family 5 domain-containing protein n=1 Tax=Bondarzewia mesenterica TaxID=1095465 RepID=A0A4S4M0D8_9AGAM|nr:hypothetical protein EW146_g2512 [Bondarzewia mesenterica]
MMLCTVNTFNLLLKTLRLTQELSKPSPATTDQPAVNANTTAGHFSPLDDTVLGDLNQFGVESDTGQLSSDPCHVDPYSSPTVAIGQFPPFNPTQANVYRYRQQQSVNLGSWFVHEQWMTPSVFACASGGKISELDIATGWGNRESARAVLERHWDTFINDTDFQYLASIGINTVRLPIGYWSLGPLFCSGTPFEPVADVYRNAWPQIVRALNMADNAGIGVLVDLHGAPGSQNGQQHSGISDGATNLFGNPWWEDKTIDVLTYLVKQLSTVTNVVGIQMLNEPKNVPELADFYARAISAMRQISPDAASFPLYLHDGFDLQRFSDFIAARNDFIVQDYHSYFVFTPSDNAESAHDHTGDIEGSIADSLQQASKHERRNIVIDEWSCALTADSLSHEADPGEAQRLFCTGQMNVYTDATAGWAFWSYRKEECDNDPGWCFIAAVGRELPSSFFSYGRGPVTNPAQLQNLTDMGVDASGFSSAVQAAFATPTAFFQSASDQSPSFSSSSQDPSFTKRDGTPSDLAAIQRSIFKGYSDGYLTAKIFALHGLSRLGFVGQYIEDSLRTLQSNVVVAPGTEDFYRTWFIQGLGDGEAVVRRLIVRGQ